MSRDEPTLLDHYGAEDAGEFFARGHGILLRAAGRLSQESPQLYEALRDILPGDGFPARGIK